MRTYRVMYRPFRHGRRHMGKIEVRARNPKNAEMYVRLLKPSAKIVAVWQM